MVTAGATQGLHLVLSILSESSAPILVEDPTYFLGLRIFQKDLEREVIPGDLHTPHNSSNHHIIIFTYILVNDHGKKNFFLKSNFQGYIHRIVPHE